jgi:hypothetical protein
MQTEKFDYQKFIAKLVSFSPRQVEGEKKAGDFLISLLKKNVINFVLQKFSVEIPLTQRATLLVNGKKMKCEGCSFSSGKIKNNDVIISSLLSSSICQEIPNINFNPRCAGISLKNYYFVPALCVNYREISKVIGAKKVEGEVVVERVRHQSVNILVGNIKNPKTISFAHYDSIKKGAIDNASGVAILMKAILEKPEILKDNLLIFSGSEELSYDKPIYWGRGFRAFEKEYSLILNKAKKIIVVDCVGNACATVIKDLAIAKLAFPILNLNKVGKKVEIITADLDDLMQVYHSDLDDGRKITKKYFEEAFGVFMQKVKIS